MRKIQLLTTITMLAGLFLSACGSSQPEATPTPGLEQIQTAAVQTFEAALTQTAVSQPTAAPTSTPAATSTPFPTFAPLGTVPPVSTSVGTVNTCNRLVYIKDVTIPDNTPMTPGQTFTKTWQVQNSGTCAWAVGFKFVLIDGNAMGGQALTLSEAVAAGAQYEISIPMTAPTNKTGAIKGTWRMADAAGVFFGDPIYVLIVIGGTNTSTATINPNVTATATATINPSITLTATPTANATEATPTINATIQP